MPDFARKKIRRKKKRRWDEHQTPTVSTETKPQLSRQSAEIQGSQRQLGNQETLRKFYAKQYDVFWDKIKAEKLEDADILTLVTPILSNVSIFSSQSKVYELLLEAIELDEAVFGLVLNPVQNVIAKATADDLIESEHLGFLLEMMRVFELIDASYSQGYLPQDFGETIQNTLEMMDKILEDMSVFVGVDDEIDEEIWHEELFEKLNREPQWLLVSEPDNKGQINFIDKQGNITGNPVPMTLSEIESVREKYKRASAQLQQANIVSTDSTNNTSSKLS